jgi:hypothetical protein
LAWNCDAIDKLTGPLDMHQETYFGVQTDESLWYILEQGMVSHSNDTSSGSGDGDGSGDAGLSDDSYEPDATDAFVDQYVLGEIIFDIAGANDCDGAFVTE